MYKLNQVTANGTRYTDLYLSFAKFINIKLVPAIYRVYPTKNYQKLPYVYLRLNYNIEHETYMLYYNSDIGRIQNYNIMMIDDNDIKL